MPRVLHWSEGVGAFFMGEVPLYPNNRMCRPAAGIYYGQNVTANTWHVDRNQWIAITPSPCNSDIFTSGAILIKGSPRIAEQY